MLYSMTAIAYAAIFSASLLFYSTEVGSRTIYHGIGAITIDAAAIVAGFYAISFSFVSHARGVGLIWVIVSIVVGAVVSAMHLAKWMVRSRIGQ